MSPDDRRRTGRPRPAASDRSRGRGAGAGTGAGTSKAKGGQDRGNRRRVPPALRIGVSVEPADVADRARQFRLLEADAGLELLTDRVVGPWVDRTPEGVVVDVRVHRLLTHHPVPMDAVSAEVRDLLPPTVRAARQVYADDLPDRALELVLDRMLGSVRPLQEFGKLGALVFPFPSYVVPGSKAQDYFSWLRERAGDLPIAVELRNRTWVDSKHREATLAFLTEHRLGYVCVDVPPGYPSSLPPLAVATTDTAYVRFHGRDADAWERGADSGDDRMRYDYRRGDLEPWDARLAKLAAAVRSVHVVFTTGRGEQAARDARLLLKVLSEEPRPEPPPAPRPNQRGRGSRNPPHRR